MARCYLDLGANGQSANSVIFEYKYTHALQNACVGHSKIIVGI